MIDQDLNLSPEMLEAAARLTEAAINRDPSDECDCGACGR